MGQNTARLVGGAAAAVAVAVLVVALLPRIAPQTAPRADVTPTATPPDAATAMAAPTPAASAKGPTVDTFYLGSNGVAVVAGQARPGAVVTVLLDGQPVGQAQADASGGFATTAEIVASDQPRSLSFAEDDAGPSGETVLVRPGAGAQEQVAMAEAEVTALVPEDTSEPQDTADAAAPLTATAELAVTPIAEADVEVAEADGTAIVDASPEEDIAPPVAAPTIVVDDAGARVLGEGPRAMDRVALDAITYDATGGVQLAGRAPGDTTLQVYVDNRPVTTGPVGPQGDWRMELPEIAAGTYTLRIDEVAVDGTVTSRVETPFRREAPADVAALNAGAGGLRVMTQTVQPGNTLWAIARDRLGGGPLYVALFEANANQIRDPDLIYPGQVFVIPDR